MKTDNDRIYIIDIIRGIALLGILLSHIASFFGAYDISQFNSNNPPYLDLFLNKTIDILISNKAFIMFSFLFGVSFYIQMKSYEKNGIKKWKFLWRLFILFILGLIHGLLYDGDILSLYAIVGIFLVLFYNFKTKILIIIILLILIGIPDIIYNLFLYNPNDYKSIASSIGDTVKIFNDSSFNELVKYNIDFLVPKYKFHLSPNGRGFQILSLFLLGFVAGRLNYIEKFSNTLKINRKYLVLILLISMLFKIFSMLLFNLSERNLFSFWYQIAVSFYGLHNLSFAVLIVLSILLLYQKDYFRIKLNFLIPYGRMGLTNYILQTIIFLPIFYGFGLGLSNHINILTGIIIAIIMSIIQIYFSHWWLKRHYYGPLEWLWRSLTWLKWQPLSRKN